MINLIKLLRVGLIELKRKRSWTSERAYKEVNLDEENEYVISINEELSNMKMKYKL